MKKLVDLLKQHNIDFSREVFYVLLHCIDKRVDSFDDLVSLYKDRIDFTKIKQDYKIFYDYMMDYFNGMEIDKEMMLHHKVISLMDVILEDNKKLQEELKMVISNVIDLIFMKYHLNITEFRTNQEIKNYLNSKIGDEKVANLLVLLLLADTSLTNKDIEHIPEEEFENIISSIILISIYICKGNK